MVDAEDLKSFDHCDRVGSSPTIPTKNLKNSAKADFYLGCVAQLVRALRSHRRGRRFESAHIHQNKGLSPYFLFLYETNILVKSLAKVSISVFKSLCKLTVQNLILRLSFSGVSFSGGFNLQSRLIFAVCVFSHCG